MLVGDLDLRDGVDQIADDVHEHGQATTSAATPAELCDAYQRALADSDGDGVVAVHLSAQLSGTVGAAESTAADIGESVKVVDSRTVARAARAAAENAARAAADGSDVDTVDQAARAAVARNHGFIVVHRLDNLRRSGRIGGAAAWLGTALALKPLLRIDDGKLVLEQRVRTASKAVAALIDRVCDVVGDSAAAIAVHHVADPHGADEVAAELAERLPACQPAIVTDLGPVLALHVGPGALAVCVEMPE
jgi:DegV family protein with EDD domain